MRERYRQEEQGVLRERYLQRIIWPAVRSPLVYRAFSMVDRYEFVPWGSKPSAYESEVIQLDEGSSISEPKIVAVMIDLLRLTGNERVLEVGTASGYGAAVLSRCSRYVYTIEHNRDLAKKARKKLEDGGYDNVKVHIGDGVLGLPQKAPFDAIIVTAGAKEIPNALVDQLAQNGRIVIPVGRDSNRPSKCELVFGIKRGDSVQIERESFVSFHPLVSNAHGGWSREELEAIQTARERQVADESTEIGDLDDLVRRMGLKPRATRSIRGISHEISRRLEPGEEIYRKPEPEE